MARTCTGTTRSKNYSSERNLGDLAVAQASGYQFKDFKLAAGNVEILSFSRPG